MDRHDIGALVPHDGAMVLLDAVESWTERDITCTARSHQRADNPLRRASRLPAICGIEYGAQAMAVHGALVAGGKGRPGVLASLRKVAIHVDRLDDVAGDLTVRAEVMLGDRDRMIYGFSISAAGAELLAGQAAVFLL